MREIAKKGGGGKEFVQLEKDKKQFIQDKVKEGIETAQVGFDPHKLVQEIQRLPKESVAGILEFSRTTRQNIIEGKTFISDEEAAALGVAFTSKTIELKMGMLDLIDTGTTLVVSLVSAPTEFDLKRSSNEITQLVWKGILVSKVIDSIAGAARAISSKSVLSLTLTKIRNGSRLTKR